jgi:glycosyltransferase involved in cell wall biosynthesis
LKVLFVTRSRGGPGKWANELSSYLERKGHTISWFKLNYDKKKRVIDSISAALRVFGRPDLIHTSHSIEWILLTHIFGAKTPQLYTLHGDFTKEINSLRQSFWKTILDRFDSVTVPCNYLANRLNLSSVKVIPNGLDVSIFPNLSEKIFNQDQITLISVTNFDFIGKAHGIVKLIEAFSKLNKKYQLRLLILGDGKFRHRVEKYFSLNGIEYLGYKSNVMDYLKKADLFVYSTFQDIFPYAVLEGMACGLPVVTVPTGGIPEMIGDSGIVIEPEKLHLGIETLLEDYEMARSLGKKGRERAENYYDINKIGNLFIKCYEELLAI